MFLNSRILRNCIGIFISEAISKTCVFLANILLARRLGVESFGFYTLAQTIILCVWIGSDVGTYMYGIREISRQKQSDDVIGPLLEIKIFFGILFFCIYSVTVAALPCFTTQAKLTLFGCGFYLLTYPIYMDWVLRGMEEFKYLTLTTLISSSFFLITVALYVDNHEYESLAASLWSASFLIGGLPLIYIIRNKLKKSFKIFGNLKKSLLHLKKSIFFAITGLFSMLYGYIPIIILGFLAQKYEIGIWSAAYKIVIILSAPGYYVFMALFPVISELYWRGSEEFRFLDKSTFILSGFCGLIAAGICFLFAERIVLTLYGIQYIESIDILKILIWVLPLQFIRYKFATFISSTDFQKLQIIPNLLAIIFFFACIFLSYESIKSLTVYVVASECVLVIAYFVLSKLTYGTKRSA